jgi:hypothetical protein
MSTASHYYSEVFALYNQSAGMNEHSVRCIDLVQLHSTALLVLIQLRESDTSTHCISATSSDKYTLGIHGGSTTALALQVDYSITHELQPHTYYDERTLQHYDSSWQLQQDMIAAKLYKPTAVLYARCELNTYEEYVCEKSCMICMSVPLQNSPIHSSAASFNLCDSHHHII